MLMAIANPNWNPVRNSPMYCTNIVIMPKISPAPIATPISPPRGKTSCSDNIKYVRTDANINPVRNMIALKNL